MGKKFKVVRFIPTLVVEHNCYGFSTLETSGCLYDTVKDARECLESMKKWYGDFPDTVVVRSSVIRKVIEL